MTWAPRYRFRHEAGERRAPFESLRANEQCFIRKEHRCGKIYGASKSCFIACPTHDELEPILELISEKISKVGVEPIIAVKERAYGQDIFCTKICGKIIESRFCIVILDDTVTERVGIPNPNVYYEYGLMTSLRKHIIPLQKADMKLAFNIQSDDTVKYNSKNIASELDRAIKDAIRITESREKEETTTVAPEKTTLRRLEMAGFDLKGEGWFLSEVIDDTLFRGFEHPERGFYVYLGKIDGSDEYQPYLEDLGVVFYRTEKKASELAQELAGAIARHEEFAKALKGDQERDNESGPARQRLPDIVRQRLRETERNIADARGKLERMATMYVGFVANPQLDIADFRVKVDAIATEYKRYRVSFSSGLQMAFGDLEVVLGYAGA